MDDLLRGGTAVLVYFYMALRGGGKAPIDRTLATLDRWRQRVRARRELAGFDDYLLHDIGLSRSQAQFEIDKPFWRA